jgi:hypothetical protein
VWWQQLKQSRTRLGKSKINRWEKLLKHKRLAFLPHNYTRTMYQRLQNLSQGSKTVDEYTEEFYKYLTLVELDETDDQLVSRYIGGLRQNIQNSLNLFDPVNVSAAHQRALLLEKTAARGSTGFFGRGTGGSTTCYNGPFTPRNTTQSSIPNRAPTTTGPPSRSATTNGPKCFKCGEPGTELRIAAREINIERVYSLTRETPSMSKAMKKRNKPLLLYSQKTYRRSYHPCVTFNTKLMWYPGIASPS